MVLGSIVNRDSSRRRRRQAVVAHYVAMSVFVLVWSASDVYAMDWLLFYVALAAAIVGGFIFLAVKNSTQRIAEQWGDGTLDERQREVRDYAYRWAYRILGSLLLIGFVYLQFVLIMDLPLPGKNRASMLFPIGIWLITSLPTSIVAWTEPDPEPDR